MPMPICKKCSKTVDRKESHFEVKTVEYQALTGPVLKGTKTCKTVAKDYYHSRCLPSKVDPRDLGWW